MKPKSRKIAAQILLFVLVLVVMTAVAVWLGLGPVVHSSAS
jgi:hypothetical protein